MGFGFPKKKQPQDVFKEVVKPSQDDDFEPIEQPRPVLKAKAAVIESNNTKAPKERIIVVKELPVQKIRQATEEDGTIVHFVTVEEYLTEMANEED